MDKTIFIFREEKWGRKGPVGRKLFLPLLPGLSSPSKTLFLMDNLSSSRFFPVAPREEGRNRLSSRIILFFPLV